MTTWGSVWFIIFHYPSFLLALLLLTFVVVDVADGVDDVCVVVVILY